MNWVLRRPLLGVTRFPFFRRGIEEFFDTVTKAGETPVAGRAWKPRELRLKSLTDLHKLWYILLKERNKLLTEKAQVPTGKTMLNPARINKVRESMRGVKVVIGERMRLSKAERKLELTKDPKEKDLLLKKIDELRTITGTPAMVLPEEEVPYEERVMQVPRPVVDKSWWMEKAKKKADAREQRRKDRDDPEAFARQQAEYKEMHIQRDLERAESTRVNKENKLRNRARKKALKVAKSKTPIIEKTTKQKKLKKVGVKSRVIASSKK